MAGKTINIRSRDGGEFDCYLVTPETEHPVPAVVLASAVHGVDADIRAIADEFAASGLIVAAPDLFWRSIPGPLSRDDIRAASRSQPRLKQIKTGESDMADTLAYVGTQAKFNGRAAAMGFCYGGPYAVLGPKRLGYAAGISCHGTQMLDYVDELDAVGEPVCIVWGDQDQRAPVKVLDAYRGMPSRMKNVEVHIFPGAVHGYMMRANPQAFHPAAYDFSMRRALTILEGLRRGRPSELARER
jgi:carboxymethylenebutenolidase